jgi:hypothetical protein
MTSLAGESRTDTYPDAAVITCVKAIDGLGWRIATVESTRAVAYVD